MKSYLGKQFIIEDPQSRLRVAGDLLTYVVGADAKPKIIPAGTSVAVLDTETLKDSVFVNVGGWGWTAASNLKNKFLNQTLRTIEPPDSDQKGAHAAWDGGHFLRQLTLVEIVGADNQLKYLSLDTAPYYLALVEAAEKDGVLLPLKSGFRTYPKQAYLYNGYIRHLPGFNLAAKPGFSNHEDGFAHDFAIAGYEGNPRYDWLKKNGPRFGFVRTVNKEPWHWEYRPEIAKSGVYKTARVTT